MWRVLVMLCVCGCGAGDEPAHADGQVDGGTDATPGPGGGAGGSGGGMCERVARPRALRQMRVIDSRGVEPDTLVLAAAPEPQTLWLPGAAENAGATVVVKEAAGVSRRLSVFTTGNDTFLDGTNEHIAEDEWSSRTLIAAADDASTPVWVLIDPVE